MLSGKEKILTTSGYRGLEVLEKTGEKAAIYNVSGDVVSAPIWCDGEAEMVTIITAAKISDGGYMEITCTPDHLFLTIDGSICRADNLTGQKLMPYALPPREVIEEAVAMGYIQARGHIKSIDYMTLDGISEIVVPFDDPDMSALFHRVGARMENDRSAVVCKSWIAEMREWGYWEIPSSNLPSRFNDMTPEYKASWLQGYFTGKAIVMSDSVICDCGTHDDATTMQASLLQDFGISATVRGDVVVIVGFENLSRLAGQIGFCSIAKTTKLATRIKDRAPYVRAVVPTETQKAYQFIERIKSWGIVDGVIAHDGGVW